MPPRRPAFPWARAIFILLILGVLAYILIPRYLNVSAMGLVEGDLVPVAPLFRARIQQKLVECGQDVRVGQPLAVVTNFLLEGDYSQNYQRALQDLNTQQIAQTQGLEEALSAEAAARERYESSVYDARKLEVLKDAYEQTYRQGAIGKVAYDSALANWRAAQSEAESMRQLLAEAQQRVSRIQAENAQRVAGASAQVGVLNQLRNQVHSQTLGAPVDGRVVDCTAEPLAIVDPGTAIFKIFSVRRSYILGYFDPGAAQRIRVGETASVSIPGLPAPVTGTVVMIYPTIQRLPDELTRYFWQHEQWSQYRPVKIVLSRMDGEIRDQLAYGAQVHITIRQHDFPGIAQR